MTLCSFNAVSLDYDADGLTAWQYGVPRSNNLPE